MKKFFLFMVCMVFVPHWSFSETYTSEVLFTPNKGISVLSLQGFDRDGSLMIKFRQDPYGRGFFQGSGKSWVGTSKNGIDYFYAFPLDAGYSFSLHADTYGNGGVGYMVFHNDSNRLLRVDLAASHKPHTFLPSGLKPGDKLQFTYHRLSVSVVAKSFSAAIRTPGHRSHQVLHVGADNSAPTAIIPIKLYGENSSSVEVKGFEPSINGKKFYCQSFEFEKVSIEKSIRETLIEDGSGAFYTSSVSSIKEPVLKVSDDVTNFNKKYSGSVDKTIFLRFRDRLENSWASSTGVTIDNTSPEKIDCSINSDFLGTLIPRYLLNKNGEKYYIQFRFNNVSDVIVNNSKSGIRDRGHNFYNLNGITAPSEYSPFSYSVNIGNDPKPFYKSDSSDSYTTTEYLSFSNNSILTAKAYDAVGNSSESSVRLQTPTPVFNQFAVAKVLGADGSFVNKTVGETLGYRSRIVVNAEDVYTNMSDNSNSKKIDDPNTRQKNKWVKGFRVVRTIYNKEAELYRTVVGSVFYDKAITTDGIRMSNASRVAGDKNEYFVFDDNIPFSLNGLDTTHKRVDYTLETVYYYYDGAKYEADSSDIVNYTVSSANVLSFLLTEKLFDNVRYLTTEDFE